MKKMLKQAAALAMAGILTAGLAACGGEKNEPVNQTNAGTDTTSAATGGTEGTTGTQTDGTQAGEPQTEPEDGLTPLTDADGNVYDLGGVEIIIGDWWSSDEEAEPTNDYEEARAEYKDWIEETYNFTIKQVAISTWGDMPEDFVNYATSGGDEYYLFVMRQGAELVSAMGSGLMYDLSTLECLDFTQEKWRSGVHELMAKNGAIYGMRAIDPEPRGGMFFNKRLLEEAGIDPEDLYKWQEAGEWTWDKFEELCAEVHKDTDNDGIIDQYAMASQSGMFYSEAVYSNGGEFIGKDESGKYINKLETEETMEAMNWAYRMRNTYEMVYPEDSEWDYSYTAFANGEAVFCPEETYNAGGKWSEENMKDDFGFVCFPKGPKASDYTNCYNDNIYAIPACYDADKAWKIAFAYNLLTDPVPGYEDYEGWKSGFYTSFRDTESVDLSITRMMENGMVTYQNMVAGVSMGDDLFWAINEDNTPAQQAEAIRNTWQAYLDEANSK